MENLTIELAKKVASRLNSGLSTKEFIAEMSNQHRTLQQLFTKLCRDWLEHCGSDEYRFDGRNEASHELGKKFLEIEDRSLPFI